MTPIYAKEARFHAIAVRLKKSTALRPVLAAIDEARNEGLFTLHHAGILSEEDWDCLVAMGYTVDAQGKETIITWHL